MAVRLAVAFGVLSLVAVIAAALVTLSLDGRRAEVAAQRRLQTAASFMTTLLMSDRDRIRVDAQEIASRLMVQQLLQAHDGPGLTRLLPGLRQTVHDDVVAVYAADGTLVAADSAVIDLRVDEPVGLVRGALAGTAGAATVSHDGHLLVAAAAPVTVNSETIGAVLVGDLLDERFAQRVSSAADLTVALEIERGPTIATESLSGSFLTADHWAALRSRGDLWLHTTATARPQRAIARPLLGSDGRPIAAVVLGLPEASVVPIEASELPLYLGANAVLLAGLWIAGAVAAWGLSRRVVTARPASVDGLPDGPAGSASGSAATNGEDPATATTRQLADLTIDRSRRRVQVGEREVTLTPTEFDLLWVLAAEPGRVMTREELLAALRGVDWHAEPGLLDTHVSNLRRKVEPDPAHPRYVLTVRGVGYRLADDVPLPA
jgi:DNA-binding winged helix-turn-helix (wHTH) protein